MEESSRVRGLYSRLAKLITENKAVALATVIVGQPLGAKLLLQADGAREGAIHPSIDEQVAQDALAFLRDEKNQVVSYAVEGGKLEVFIECFPPPQRLIIIGAVHVAIPLHRLAKMLGYHITVVDARSLLATHERFPEADRLVVEWPDDALRRLKPDANTSVVVLTHHMKFDVPALCTALRSEARYIGAIGSRATNLQRFAALREEGVAEEQIARIYAPVGLDIGAVTPAQIALAVLAEIVAVRYGREGGHLRQRPGRRPATQAVSQP